MSAQPRSSAWFSFGRVGAMCLRHFYILKSSWPRLLEMAYWPTMQMIIWGFISTFLTKNSSYVAGAFGVLIAAAMLWDVLFRGQLGFSLSFLEEFWARNLGNLYCSPLTPFEHVVSLFTMAVIRCLIGVLPAMVLAIPFYHYSIFGLGLPLGAFFFCLMLMGCNIGLVVTAMILRFGVSAENLAWFVVFLLAPVSCVYYPISILPGWLQVVAHLLPSSYVFEGMRAQMFDHVFRWDLFGAALGLNLVYLLIGLGTYLWSFSKARQLGLLLQVGE